MPDYTIGAVLSLVYYVIESCALQELFSNSDRYAVPENILYGTGVSLRKWKKNEIFASFYSIHRFSYE